MIGGVGVLVGDHSNYFCIPYVMGLILPDKVRLFGSAQSVEHCPLQSIVRTCQQLHFFRFVFLFIFCLRLFVCICLFDLSALISFSSLRFFCTEYSW